jgi:hypothetical protein
METFILIVMLCTADANDQEYCVPLAEEPRVYYKSEKDCIINSLAKKKQIKQSVKNFNMNVSSVYAACINEENPVRVPISFYPYVVSSDDQGV